MKSSFTCLLGLSTAMLLAACAQSGPVELSVSGADAPSMTRPDDLDFSAMDHTVSTCKSVAKKAGPGRCTQVRAYEGCMKDKGYLTLLGPENPSDCGQPAWEQDARKWLR